MCSLKDQFVPESSKCDGLIDCIDRTDESNCVKPTSKPYEDIFEDCRVNGSNNFHNYANEGDLGFQCGSQFCLDTNIWCNGNGFQEKKDLHLLSAICPRLIDQIRNPILCSNRTFWTERPCNGVKYRHKGNKPGRCIHAIFAEAVDSKFCLFHFSTSLSTRFPSVRPFLPLISAPNGFHDWGLVTRWAQLMITPLTINCPA